MQNGIESQDIDDNYEAFLNKFGGLYNKYFPLVFFKQSHLDLQKPWITQCILISIKKKARYYKHSLKKKSVYTISNYKCYTNKLTKLIKTAKKILYQQI